MSRFDEFLGRVPMSQLASQFGVDESQLRQAAESALPALLGGLHANAGDPAGASSILAALGQHQGGIPTDLDALDVQDGERIVGHIFGDNTDQVVHQLGGVGGGSLGPLVKKLLPILAPMVLSWLAGRVGGKAGGGGGLGDILGGGGAAGATAGEDPSSGPLFPGGQGAQSGSIQTPSAADSAAGTTPTSGGGLQDILGQVLGGGSGAGGDLLGGILGGLLGGGRR